MALLLSRMAALGGRALATRYAISMRLLCQLEGHAGAALNALPTPAGWRCADRPQAAKSAGLHVRRASRSPPLPGEKQQSHLRSPSPVSHVGLAAAAQPLSHATPPARHRDRPSHPPSPRTRLPRRACRRALPAARLGSPIRARLHPRRRLVTGSPRPLRRRWMRSLMRMRITILSRT